MLRHVLSNVSPEGSPPEKNRAFDNPNASSEAVFLQKLD
jgi:hypothetical protein